MIGFAIVALILVLLVAVLLVAGLGGGHGPGRHASVGANHTPPAGVTGGGVLRA